jgi:ATP-dependent protease ClpP protease subunit
MIIVKMRFVAINTPVNVMQVAISIGIFLYAGGDKNFSLPVQNR